MSDIHRRLQRQMRPGVDGDKATRGMLAFRNRKLDFSETSERKGVLGSRKRENDSSEEVYHRSPPKEAPAQLPEK